MNEEQKNIETCLAEDVLSEVANVPTDPQFRSLVEESFDPLQQQALQQAGYDGYIKVAGTHQPYTFTSSVKQMKSNLILLLRRLWRYPFGRGTTASSDAGSASAGSSAASAVAPIRSLADMWQHYINRLKGNPEYGIPSRLSQLTDLPDAPALLADRDMSSGIRFGTNPLPDGMSLINFLCSDKTPASSVTEIVDDNVGWTIGTNSNVQSLFSIFKNIEIFNANCTGELNRGIFNNNATLRVISMPFISSMVRYESSLFAIGNCANLEEVILPSATYVYAHSVDYPCIHNCPNLRKLVLGRLTNYRQAFRSASSENLIHFEIGEGTGISLDFSHWTATNVLSNPKFLSNFKTYIAERLTDKGSGLTLTLSQEVRNAIHAAENEYGIENIIITQKGWTISPAPN